VRACLTPVRDGMRVASQNSYGDLDPTALIDAVFRGGIDHHHMVVYPRVANQMMQGVARNLTGFGELPDAAPPAPATCVQHSPEVLIVGAGLAGSAAGELLRRAGAAVRVFDRRAGVRVFAAYPHEGVWAASESIEGAAPTLHLARPRHVILALGAHVPTIPLPGNDIPGVVAARGLRDLLRRTGRTLAVPVVVIGSGAEAEAHAAALSAQDSSRPPKSCASPVAAASRPSRRRRAGSPVASSRSRRTPPPRSSWPPRPAPQVRWTGAGFAPVCAADGRAELRRQDHPLGHGERPAEPPWTVWIAGEVRGDCSPADAPASGRAVATAILQALGKPVPEASHV
jgi:sarcosine oxidase subunit alpha